MLQGIGISLESVSGADKRWLSYLCCICSIHQVKPLPIRRDLQLDLQPRESKDFLSFSFHKSSDFIGSSEKKED